MTKWKRRKRPPPARRSADAMANFIEKIFHRLEQAPGAFVFGDFLEGAYVEDCRAAELLAKIQEARGFLREAGLRKGDRCALLAHNSQHWVALDLALMAEGMVVVPLYARQAPAELAAMIRDCEPQVVCCGDDGLRDALQTAAHGIPRCVTFREVFSNVPPSISIETRETTTRFTKGQEAFEPPVARAPGDLVTIIYTSGTSGEAKGVCLNVANLDHMLACTSQRLDQLMAGTAARRRADRVFHYLPMNFAGSSVLMLTCLLRGSALTLSQDLNKLADEIKAAQPDYFLNVPTLLERVRRGVEENIAKRPAIVQKLYARARDSWQRQHVGRGGSFDVLWVTLGRRLIFTKIKERFGANLQALICGSAPLAPETQLFFMMLGISVLQVYGLTETTGICTMDDPCVPVEPGCVGPAISGIEMKLAENDEIAVRGPNIFPGYWKRPEETAKVLRDGWFHTGDQGEVNVRGNWRIVGRIKNLIILNSGHNIAPEPIEDRLAQHLSDARQVVLVGNGRSYLCALVTGNVQRDAIQAALDEVNRELPHYRQIRNFAVIREAFSAEDGLLTAMGKLKRDAINARYAAQIDGMYERKVSA